MHLFNHLLAAQWTRKRGDSLAEPLVQSLVETTRLGGRWSTKDICGWWGHTSSISCLTPAWGRRKGSSFPFWVTRGFREHTDMGCWCFGVGCLYPSVLQGSEWQSPHTHTHTRVHFVLVLAWLLLIDQLIFIFVLTCVSPGRFILPSTSYHCSLWLQRLGNTDEKKGSLKTDINLGRNHVDFTQIYLSQLLLFYSMWISVSIGQKILWGED